MGKGSFTSFQATVSLLAGLASISGAAYSAVRFVSPETGELVAIVRAGDSDKRVPGATIEILTPQDAVVATLAGDDDGRVRRELPDGPYRLRVTAPRFEPQTRDVQVQADAVAEVRFALVAREERRPESRSGGKPVSRGVGAAQRFLQRLGL